jgi:hypothetical protein
VTLVAEVHELDDDFDVHRVARFLLTPQGAIDVIELRPDGAALARVLLAETLPDPFGRTVTRADGADYLRALRWTRSTDFLWITPLVEVPADRAQNPATTVRFPSVPHVPATVPYPEPPAALSGVRVVEIRRPAREDYCRSEVVARLVEVPDRPPTVEGPDEAGVRQIEALFDALGRPPLDELTAGTVGSGLVAEPVRFDQPGDLAWRNALVGTRRATRDSADIARLDLEFATLLPRIWLSRCPFTDEVLRMPIDAWGFDSPFWDPTAPTRPADDLPSTYLGLAGRVVDADESGAIPVEAVGGRRAPVFARVIEDPAIRAVLSAVHVGGHRCDVVAYFAQPRPAGPPAFREWGTHLAVAPDGPAWQWVPGPQADPPATGDLEPLLRSGKLSWIEPFDMSVTLRQGPDGCPWLPKPSAG